MYQDEILTCKVCKGKFVFSAEEQEFYASKGFKSKPTTCKACRQARADKGLMETIRDPSRRKEYTCSLCGKRYVATIHPITGEVPAEVLGRKCPACVPELYKQILLGGEILLNQALGYPR